MRRLHRYLLILALSLLTVLLTGFPGQSANLIHLRLGPFKTLIPVEAIKTFAATGTSPSLNIFLNRLNDNQRSQLRSALRATYDLNPAMVGQFTYTASGVKLLEEMGAIFQTASGNNGAQSLRSAAILTTAETGGASLLKFLENLPVDMTVNVQRGMALQQKFAGLLRSTAGATAFLTQKNQKNSADSLSSADFSQMDLRQPGIFSVKQQTLTFEDAERDRRLVVDLYLPQQAPTAPIIVMSNGLGARRERFVELAGHLASHGFAVVIPDHPGSDRDRLDDFYWGLYRENFDAAEYIDRPLDITYLLNQLERLNQTTFNAALDLQRVGVFGYSFGGTTALSLVGAEMQFPELAKNCRSRTYILNISLLYQCRALELSPAVVQRDLQDARVKAVYVFVPFGASLFGGGLSNVSAPVLWEASNEDFLTPLLIEQTPAFGQLTTPDKYFVLSKGVPHAQINHAIISRLSNARTNWVEMKALSDRYHRALTVAFFKTHLAQDERYRPYLSSTYATALTEGPYALSLLRSIEGVPAWKE